MTDKSINDILMEAHKEIREKYGVVIETVNYQLINTSTTEQPSWTTVYAEIEGKTV